MPPSLPRAVTDVVLVRSMMLRLPALVLLLVAPICALAEQPHVATGKSKSFATFRPAPEYPFAARAARITGSGVFILRIDIRTGTVTQVILGLSTGSELLDKASAQALIQWRFKPGAVPYVEVHSIRLVPPQTKGQTFVKVPVTFTM
jgi:TonB family protein